MIIDDLETIWDNFKSYMYQLLFYHGRNIWTIMGLLSMLLGLIKRRFSKDEVYLIISVLFFILSYMIFCSINFFTTRYLLSVLPWFFYIVIIFIYKAFREKRTWSYILIVFLIVVSFFKTIQLEGESDIVLTYKNSVELHKNAVNFCEKQEWHDKKIYTGFLMKYNLLYPNLGYLEGEKPFKNIVNKEDADILIFYSNEPDPLYEKCKSDSLYISIYRFENKGAWVEIFKKKENF